MSDSGDDAAWVPYKERPEWGDVTPVKEDDGSNPVVVIAYSEKLLQLTKDAVELNPANYTVWQYRRDILKALGGDLMSELDYMEAVIKQSPKNYQDPSRELELTGDALLHDPKNYHAWQHRQWAMKTFGLLTDDVRNNSAWNQRYFIVNNHLGWSDINVQKEICYTLEKIKFIKNNESAWNYLRGVLLHDKRGLSGNAVVTSFCEELYKNKCRSSYLLAFLIDICDEALKKGENNSLHNCNRAMELCAALANKYDKIRSKYWNYISTKFIKYQTESESNKNGADKLIE
ncbi:Farnesyltransferase/geranylgeranyltransferase type I alpha subunit [Operophtera brumata]|uniref:Protein farnesyltransferase/geranylgeranyltransferase type-1 subunit alpha n=1 Tax=Operophtera brumata TaxID=104452 RepID=A0A0L7KWJ0_OPEBR|nr:Farnesyltransferase/geranylgeranyltransferase type I alpha subunit [Operophtera brumata]